MSAGGAWTRTRLGRSSYRSVSLLLASCFNDSVDRWNLLRRHLVPRGGREIRAYRFPAESKRVFGGMAAQ